MSKCSHKECREIYFAALLHDVGKIGIPDTIINKEGKLTDEEFAAIKKHPVIGNQILSRITKSPYLSIGAHFHHERYDGRGYPDGLKGDDIPSIARIIALPVRQPFLFGQPASGRPQLPRVYADSF